VKRSAAQYAVLSRLLDDALALDEPARANWLAALPVEYAAQRATLDRMLTFDRRASHRTLLNLEGHLRSSARSVNELLEKLQACVPPDAD